MDNQKFLKNWTPLEISTLEFEFAMRYYGFSAMPKDYGTGVEYSLAEAHGVTFIEEHPGVTVTEMADAFGRTQSALSQSVKQLEQKGLVYKLESKENKKKNHLFVTPKGRQLSMAHKQYDIVHTMRFIKDLENIFTEEELDCFFRIMKVRADLMRDCREAPTGEQRGLENLWA